jgi:hypothetical protein
MHSDAAANGQIGTQSDDAQFVVQNVPTSLAPGQIITVSVYMKNTGTATWTPAQKYRLGSENPNNNMTWGIRRAELPAGTTVAPGGTAIFNFDIKAPTTPGTYDFQWRMVHEVVTWFGQMTPNVKITVAEPQGETIDTLSYFLGKHDNKTLLANPANLRSGLTLIHAGNKAYTMKGAKEDALPVFELHTWDSNNIYLNEDHPGTMQSIYSFSNPVWMKRSMRIGETLGAVGNVIQRYDASCNKTVTEVTPYFTMLEKHYPNYDLGGDLGVQDVIVLAYRYAGGLERFWYSREWGWIGWVQQDPITDEVMFKYFFNHISPPLFSAVGRSCTMTDTPPGATIDAVPNPTGQRLTSNTQSPGSGIISGTATDDIGIAAVDVVIRRGPFNNGICDDAVHDDWYNGAWRTACLQPSGIGLLPAKLAAPRASPNSPSISWLIIDTPPTDQMTKGQIYSVQVRPRDGLGQYANPRWIRQDNILFQ